MLQAAGKVDAYMPASKETVLRLQGEWLSILLHDPATLGVSGGSAVLLLEDNFARILLRFHAESSLVGEKVVVVKDRRQLSDGALQRLEAGNLVRRVEDN